MLYHNISKKTTILFAVVTALLMGCSSTKRIQRYGSVIGIDKENIQVLFVYRFQPPFGLIQLVYQKGTAAFGEAGTQGHTLFLKVAYVF